MHVFRIARRPLAFIIALGFVQDGLYALIFLSSMNHYLIDVLGESPGLPAFTLALYGGVKLGIHPIAGRLLDRRSPRTVFRVISAIQVAGAATLIVWDTLPGFLVAAVLLAIASAGSWPLVYHTLGRTIAPERRAPAAAAISIGSYVATGAGLGTGSILADFGPEKSAFYVAAALVVIQALLQWAHALDPAATYTEAEHEGREAPASAAMQRTRLVLFGAIVLISYSCIASMAGLYGPYARVTLNVTLTAGFALAAPAGVAAALAVFAASRFSRPSRRLGELSLFYALAAAGAFGLAATSTRWAAAASGAPLAAGIGGVTPILDATMVDLGGGANRGLVVGTLMSVEGIGSVAGPAAVGAIVTAFDPQAGFALVGGAYALLVAVTAVASRWVRLGVAPQPSPAT